MESKVFVHSKARPINPNGIDISFPNDIDNPQMILQVLRNHGGLSQEQLGEKLDVYPQTIMRWEHPDRCATAILKFFEAMKVLGVTVTFKTMTDEK